MDVPYFLSSHLRFHRWWMSARYLLTGFVLFHHLIWFDYLWFTCFPRPGFGFLGKWGPGGNEPGRVVFFYSTLEWLLWLSVRVLSFSTKALFPLGIRKHWRLTALDSLMKRPSFSVEALAKRAAQMERPTSVPVHPLGFRLRLTGSSLSCLSYVASIFSAGLQTSPVLQMQKDTLVSFCCDGQPQKIH